MRRRSRSGFTLVEVLVALALGGMVLMGARGLLEALGAQAAAEVRAARATDTRANADALFRRALADLVVRADTVPSFVGDDSSFSFATSCDTPRGWAEPCGMRVVAERTDSGFQLRMVQDDRGVVMLRTRLARTGIRYLLSVEDGGQWTMRWQNTLMLPLGVALLAGDDTILARVGERR